MTIDYSSPGKVIFSMIDYIVKMLDDITEYIKGKSATPAAHHLFDIAEDATKLSQADADLFHHFVAQLQLLPVTRRRSEERRVTGHFTSNT